MSSTTTTTTKQCSPRVIRRKSCYSNWMSTSSTATVALVVLLLLSPPSLSSWKGCCQAVETTSTTPPSSSSSSSSSSFTPSSRSIVKRERNLDHWDADTLAYFLDAKHPGYDIAIMFYAQWDRNSHALAPIWDKIATHLEAGTTSSRLVMALFDCEYDYTHATLCEALEVTHYPTLLFVGAGPYHDVDPITKTLFGKKRSIGPMGSTPITNGVKFQGNWQYGESIIDWLRTMQALSNWHIWTTVGFGKRLRNWLVPHKSVVEPLPIGIPGTRTPAQQAATEAYSSGSGLGSSGAGETAKLAGLEKDVETLRAESELYQKAVGHASVMLDAAIFPRLSTELDTTGSTSRGDSGSSSNEEGDKMKKPPKPYTDMFAYLYQIKAWESSDNDDTVPTMTKILKACTLEISLDYCQRVATHIATDMVGELEAAGTLETADVGQFEQDILKNMKTEEPYCSIIEDCIVNGMMSNESCRPSTCPFEEETACRYLTSCLDPTLQEEYAKGLVATTTTAAGGTAAGDGSTTTTSGKWGL